MMDTLLNNPALDAAAAAMVAFLAFLARSAVRFAMSAEGRVILKVLRTAGVAAALDARAELLRQIRLAQCASSEGGESITADERTRIAKGAVFAFTRALDVAKVLSETAAAFGGVEKLEAELVKRIEAKLDSAATTRAK
jgi:hypothetical protein